MAQYKCENCNELRDSVICPKCGADTHLVDEPLPHEERAAAAEGAPVGVDPLRESARTAQARPRPRPRLVASDADTAQAEHPDPEPRPREPQPQAPAPAPVASDVVGLDEFHAMLDRGTKSVIICGDADSGKSEIAHGYIRANNVYRGRAQNLTLRATHRTDVSLGATNPTEIWYQVIDDNRVFLDPSGEFFKKLSPNERQRLGLPDVTEADFQFVQRSIAALAGIVIVVDLTKAVDPRHPAPWRRQEEDLKFVLSALRWLRWDKEARPNAIGVSTNNAFPPCRASTSACWSSSPKPTSSRSSRTRILWPSPGSGWRFFTAR